MKLNDKEKIIQKELRKEVEIPDEVQTKVQEAYRMIENHEILQEKREKRSYDRLSVMAKAAGSVAAVLFVGFVVCVANPVMARELPVVGGLFAVLQDKVSFFGNFADKAEPLVEPETTEEAKDTDDGAYVKTKDGLTIRFAEVYANSQKIYLTMEVKSEEPFPDTMMMKTEQNSQLPVFYMNYTRDYSFLSELPEEYQYPEALKSADIAYPEGEFLDENTYACIWSIDLEHDMQDTSEYDRKYDEMTQGVLDEMGVTNDDLDDETEEGYALLSEFIDKVSERGGSLRSEIKQIPVPETFTLSLNIEKFVGAKANPEYWDNGYSEEELSAMSDKEWREVMNQVPEEYRTHPNKHENFWYEGGWEFEIPITIDDSQTEILEINETNDKGVGLKSIMKTPYEITIEELYEEGSDADSFLVALDANGNKLPNAALVGNTNNFMIQDRDISTVDIYILDYIQYMDELKGEDKYNNNENKPEEEKWSTLLEKNAKYHKTIHFEDKTE